MEDFHLHVLNLRAIKTHIKFKKLEERNNVKISISNHESLDIYDYPIVDFGNRYDVNVIKAFSILTEEGAEFSIIEPSNRAIEFLNDIQKEKIERIIHIVDNLKDEEICIDLENLTEVINGKSYWDLHNVTNELLLEEIVKEGYCEDIREANAHYLSRNDVPRKFPKLGSIFRNLQNDQVFWIDPEKIPEKISKELLTTENLKRIEGIIGNLKSQEFQNFKKLFGTTCVVLNGSGCILG